MAHNPLADPGKKLDLNKWYFVTGVHYDGKLVDIYLDGILKASVELSEDWLTPSVPGYIGCDDESPRNFFRGIIDEVRIYDQPLTKSQIQTLYVQESKRFKLTEK